jgi:RES domain-containing protein
MIFTGLTWCHVPADSHPLHLARVLRADGRWNDPGQFGALYLCTEEEGALAEYQKALETGETEGEHYLATVLVKQCHPVANLVSRTAPFHEVDHQLLTRDDAAAVAYCRQLAGRARREGYGGLLVPSAALPGAINLVVYLDVVPPPQLDLVDGPHRRTL